MSSLVELTQQIIAKADEITSLKASNPPNMKELLNPLVNELLNLKLSYKEITGEDYGPKKEEKKKKDQADVPVKTSEGPSKSELNKLKRKENKAAKKAEVEATKGETSEKVEAVGEKIAGEGEKLDEFAHLFGDSPLVQSAFTSQKVYRHITELDTSLVGQELWVRARLANSRAVGKGIFVILRQNVDTAQCVFFQSTTIPKAMVKYAAAIPLESIVDIRAEITLPEIPIISATIKSVELSVKEIHIISRSMDLPFQVEDAGRNEAEALASGMPLVNPDTSLNFRWVDTRTPANQAIFRIQSGVGQLFREFLNARNFIEIHSPKLIGGASEGGANVFKLKYFEQPACLAQSPQFYKQIAAACGGFERVYEVGPVFRAEDSNTNRHLCEFIGLDFEMAIYEHYYEVLEVLSELFTFIFDGIEDRYQHELRLISQQYPFEPIKYLRPSLRITFQEGISLLREAGFDAPFHEDISTPHEKALGKIVKEKYGTDFYMMDKYPLSVRPFYTMPDPNDGELSNSYDLFIRGEEIVSGAQRIHDVNLLVERANAWKIPIHTIQSYIDAFKHGALPHGGGGIGLERVVMLYLGLKNIRKSSMFPRDPSRLAP